MSDRTHALNSQLERALQKLDDVQREQAQQTQKIDSLTREVAHLTSQVAKLSQVSDWAQVLSTGGAIPLSVSIACHPTGPDTQVTSSASGIPSSVSSSHPHESSGAAATATRDHSPSSPRPSTATSSPSPSASRSSFSRPNKRPRHPAVNHPSEQEDGSGPGGSTYRLNRDVKTVSELWREWHEGLPGQPSVVSLESEGSNWRTNDRSYYRRRLAIIRAIKKYAETHKLSYETAVRIAEQRRERANFSLDYLAKNSSRMFPSPDEGRGTD